MTYCLVYSYCFLFYDGTHTSGIRLLVAFFRWLWDLTFVVWVIVFDVTPTFQLLKQLNCVCGSVWGKLYWWTNEASDTVPVYLEIGTTFELRYEVFVPLDESHWQSLEVCEEVTVSSGGPCVAGAAVTWEVNNFCWKQGSGISPISSGSVGWSIGQVELLTWGHSFRMRRHFKQHSGWGRRWELLQGCFYSKCVCNT